MIFQDVNFKLPNAVSMGKSAKVLERNLPLYHSRFSIDPAVRAKL